MSRFHSLAAKIISGVLLVASLGVAIEVAGASTPMTLNPVSNSISALPANSWMTAISCPTATSCVGVGGDAHGQPLVFTGNPATWSAANAQELTLGSSFNSGGGLSAINCPSATFCVAVGYDNNAQPLTFAGNPTTWGTAQPLEIAFDSSFGWGGALNGVACTSSTSCVAVGSDGQGVPFIIRGNPLTWSEAQAAETPVTGTTWDTLSAVSCSSSSACVAVGSDSNQQSIELAGNPANWSSAQPVELTSLASNVNVTTVSCAATKPCFWLGNDQQGRVASFSVTSATATPKVKTFTLPFGSGAGFINSMSCPSATECVALGSDKNGDTFTLVGNPLTWSGSSAKILKVPFGSLTAVSCASTIACSAVGSESISTVTISGTPSTWSAGQLHPVLLTGAKYGAKGTPEAMSCPTASTCVVVGTASSQGFSMVGNPAHWAQAKSTFLPLSGIPYGTGPELLSVSCSSTTSCVAVGDNGQYPMIVLGNPATWASAQATVVKVTGCHGMCKLTSISCPTATFCAAAGWEDPGTGIDVPLIVTGNPSTWSAASFKVISLGQSFGNGGVWNAITCTSATNCVAVGGSNANEPLYATGDSTKWKSSSIKQLTLGQAQGGSGGLSSVSCPSATSCIAAGSDMNGPLVVSGNPSTWSLTSLTEVQIPQSDAATVGAMSGYPLHYAALAQVACSSSTKCDAFGGDSSGSPFFALGQPSSWNSSGTQLVAPFASVQKAYFGAVACYQSSCYTVGSASDGIFLAALPN